MEVQPFDVLTALLYVRKHPGVMPAVFVKAHAPIGNVLWAELFYTGYMTINQDNALFLSPMGEEVLHALDPGA